MSKLEKESCILYVYSYFHRRMNITRRSSFKVNLRLTTFESTCTPRVRTSTANICSSADDGAIGARGAVPAGRRRFSSESSSRYFLGDNVYSHLRETLEAAMN
ncbi:hypothetical protein EVAR_89884_1 [Eumeta japonica]|uniref:Uncharacterized protein n=1 Tax=Eumeta variegata TaxID=151549 RepID=A0A4C1YTP3_EUMVA|nr:hypothetical protein EVAR_89884_1 [Eumeta japonica]